LDTAVLAIVTFDAIVLLLTVRVEQKILPGGNQFIFVSTLVAACAKFFILKLFFL
jgi:hypothetical protein